MSKASDRGRAVRTTRALAVLLACAPPAAAGCGGGGASTSTQQARGVRPVGAAAQSAVPQSAVPGGRASGAVGPAGAERARRRRGMIDDEVSSTAAKAPNPCVLVDQAEAQRILEAKVERPVLAPQGPTCIYRTTGSKRQVTLAVQLDPPGGRPAQDRLRHRMRVRIGSAHAFCGVTGEPTLILPLHGRRFIAVAAPCPLAAAFAGRALAHRSSR